MSAAPDSGEQSKPEPCDHEWKVRDDSFDHEYGTERVICEECQICGATRSHQPQHFEDDVT